LDHYQQGGPNDYLPFFEERAIKGAISAKGFLDLLYNEDKRLLVPTAVSNYNLLPSKDMFMNVNQSKVGELSWLFDKDSTLSPYITDRLIWSLKGSGLEKKDLAIIDLIVNTNWERPIYFNNTSLNAVNFNIKQHVIQEGLTYRLAPVQYNGADFLVNVEVMYDNLMNKFHWRGLDDPNAYYNEDYRSFCLNHRSAFNSLATALIDQGDNERALTVLNKSLEVMPDASIPYDVFSVYMISLFMELGETERATEISEKVAGRNVEWLEWAKETGEILRNPSEYQKRILGLNEIARTYRAAGDRENAAKYEEMFSRFYNRQ
ncbi:MAG: tetratricopeptide (TPR) repeat protein, partial [Cyclobacteriaceae bacterium]